MENNQNRNALNAGTEPSAQTTPSHAHRKQKILLIASMLICAAILASGTLAYFTAEETAYNVITTGAMEMKLVEETTGGKPWPKDGVSGVTPGMQVDKIPYVTNEGTVDFYTRARVSVKVIGENKQELSDQYVSMNYNTADWTERDGYYYFNGAVKPGEKTSPLFTVVTFDKLMGNEYMNARVEVNVEVEAVQSRNNGTDALTATGWKK